MKTKTKIRMGVVIAMVMAIIALPGCTQKGTVGGNASPEASKIAPLFESGSFKASDGTTMPYRYFEPTASGDADARFPVILYLHGEKEAGTDNESQITTTECATIWIEPDHLALNPTYVIAPQIPEGTDWTSEPQYTYTLELLNQFIDEHPAIDRNRIYIVGFSMGGTGVWNMILKNPELFAAAMPISGNADAHLGDYDAWAALKNFPAIVIHAYDDQVSPVSGSLNAVAAIQEAGNTFVSGSTKVCLWANGSTPVPHDAWYTAFHKFEVIYNLLFEQNLERTNHGEISPTTLYTKKDLGDGITRIWDHGLNTAHVIERPGKAMIVDATLGKGSLLEYIRENVLVDKDVDIDFFITHNDNDHIYGLNHFLGSDQVKNVYLHEDEKDPVIKLMGKDAGKIKFVADGEAIPMGGDETGETILVPGHSLGHTILKYKNYLFPGDAIGTGYVGVGDVTVGDFVGSVKHLLDVMGSEKYTILAGHTGECRKPMDEEYVHQLLACAEGMVNGSIKSVPYWRNARYVATNGDANITHDLNNVKKIKGALYSLTISEGTLTPVFAKYLTYFNATVGANVSSVDITAKVLEKDYKKLTINGTDVASQSPFRANLEKGSNRFSIKVTSSDDVEKTYTLTITRGS